MSASGIEESLECADIQDTGQPVMSPHSGVTAVPNHHNPAADGRLLHELALEERALIEADEALRIARNDFEVAARKYAAVRDLVTDFLGYSPYHEDAVWGAEEARIVPSEDRGAYRFLHLKPRDAIVAALDEQAGDLSLAALEERLKSGGLDLGKRAINAALMRLAGVKRTSRGTYRLLEDHRKSTAA